MTIVDDTVRGTTMADPDGPLRYIETLDCEVPTYLDPRKDLISPVGRGSTTTFKYVDYHIPFKLRGDFKPDDWPELYRKRVRGQTRTTSEGFVLCTGISKSTGLPCASKAVNRTHFCRNHGGALHPADKIVSGLRTVAIPEDRHANMDRVQKFMAGIIGPEDLDDDEVRGGFIRDSNGLKVKSHRVGIKYEQMLTKELHRRLNAYIRDKAPRALEVMYEIFDSELVEPADRLKAAQIFTDRTMGKAPEILITSTTEKPYEAILDKVTTGSREDYRKSVASSRPEIGEEDQDRRYQDAEVVDVSEMDDSEYLVPPVQYGYEENTDMERPDGDEREGFPSSGISGRETDRNSDNVGSDVDAGSEKETSRAVAEVEEKRKTLAQRREEIKKAKARRFAARAVGASSLDAMPFGMEYRLIKAGSAAGKLTLRLVAPSAMTEARLAKMNEANRLTDDALSILYANEENEGEEENG